MAWEIIKAINKKYSPFYTMKIELLIFGIASFLIVNTYYDGKYTDMMKVKMKYVKMFMFGTIALSLYIFIKKHPNESTSLLTHANDLVKYMPIDKGTSKLISPFLKCASHPALGSYGAVVQSPQQRRMLNSGRTNKRSVSETKKKYVASQQKWRCAKCGSQLSASFEVHHKTPLHAGGTNHVSNLEALCRNCHGEETMLSHL